MLYPGFLSVLFCFKMCLKCKRGILQVIKQTEQLWRYCIANSGISTGVTETFGGQTENCRLWLRWKCLLNQSSKKELQRMLSRCEFQLHNLCALLFLLEKNMFSYFLAIQTAVQHPCSILKMSMTVWQIDQLTRSTIISFFISLELISS